QELVSFYPHFRTSPPPRVALAVCRDMSCWLRGAPECTARLRGDFSSVPDCQIREVSCLGRCDWAPAGLLHDMPIPLQETSQVKRWAEEPGAMPRFTVAASRGWRCDPYPEPARRFGLLEDLLRQGRAVAAARVLDTLVESGLRGMGGAGFPTAAK